MVLALHASVTRYVFAIEASQLREKRVVSVDHRRADRVVMKRDVPISII